MLNRIHVKLRDCFVLTVFLFVSATCSYAQQDRIKITGKVLDEHGVSLLGVNVLVKGTNTGTVTDFDGNYELEATANAILVFSYVGYSSLEVEADPSGVVDVTMKEDMSQLEEVVVVGYGKVRKKDLTGGLSVVGKEKLKMVSGNNLMDRLTGQVAGLNITASNAAPGQDQGILIRGVNSLSANNDPLIVLDGIPYSGSLSDLDPNIIDNLSILKDASAVAIYGARGSNGVILIQTKRGVEGKPQVTYRGQFGMAEPMQRIDVMGPNEYIRLKQDIGRLKHGYTGDQLDPLAGDIISISERENYANGITHDWQDYVFQKGYTMDHQVTVSGGTSSTKYLASISHLDQEGVVYNSQLQRTNISTNIDQEFNDWLTIGVGSQFIQKETGGVTPNIEHAIKQSPYGKYKDEAGYYITEPMEYSLITNPMINVNADQDVTSRNFFLSAYASILLPVKGLSFRSNYGYNYRSGFSGTYYGRDTFAGREQAGLIGGKASISNNHYTDYTWENILRYELKTGDHSLDATGLFSMQETRSTSASQSGEGFVTDDSGYHMMDTAERNQTIASGLSETSLLSYMLRLNYAYKGKYMATVTGRTDGSSVFGENNKYAFFPSAALAWQIGDEPFIKDHVSWIDLLKLRVSYGANGNQAITAYRTLDRLYSNVKYIWGDGGTPVNTAYLASDGIGNPNLKWETTYSANIGVDFQFFNNRLGGTLEMYLSNTHDLLMIRTVPIMNGYSRIWDNIGQTRNKGIEIALNSVNINGEDFRWTTDLNFSLNRDKIVALRGDNMDDLGNNWFIGKPLRVYYDYNMTGIWQEGDEYFYTDADGNQREVQTGATPGSARLEDVDGNGYINTDDRKIIGSRLPDFRMSMGHRFSYRNFYASVLMNGVFGVWRDDHMANMGAWTFGITNYVHGADYWTPENPDAGIVSPGYVNNFGHGYYKKVSYVQLKNITFGYSMGPEMARKLGLSGIDVNVSVNNAHTFSNIRQVLNYDNSWMASYPTARSYMLGLNLTF
ncbi:SusC/RagA family TonB-linked outer membrane protein [Sinomicrobium soli]|uniref:SusC/RagA family TonB-linked outer membrane protein n=1 Tax=Sinomicrobium sp. N-1-3-6 TaxID=2219864 RepID=UPI000DCAFC04|nr:TonB-dependent receptor [Sinomicrobium sp. N-1-3-6]RAV31020.1 SusC/RagA family TonB-linked outer membrane protein [Sinomicrobium sp. N-1-3-6]